MSIMFPGKPQLREAHGGARPAAMTGKVDLVVLESALRPVNEKLHPMLSHMFCALCFIEHCTSAQDSSTRRMSMPCAVTPNILGLHLETH